MKTLLGWLAFALFLSLAVEQQPAAGWGWNPFAKDKKTPTKNVSATHTTLIEGRKISSPVSNQWRSTPPGTARPSAAKKVMSSAADMITFKPLRDKIAGPPASQWSSKPPATMTRSNKNAKPSFFSSLFKPAPPKPPSTVTEWINQPSPKF